MNKSNQMTKREKIIAIIAGITIVGLLGIVIFEYFTIIKVQKELSDISYNLTESSENDKIVWINPEVTVSATGDSANNEIIENETKAGSTEYVINKNSKKIHSPDCESAKQTLDKNKETVNWTDEEYFNALDEGYSPCAICKAGR